MQTISLCGGKYVIGTDGVALKALRYGEPWRDMTGDKMVHALVDRVIELEAAVTEAIKQLRGEL